MDWIEEKTSEKLFSERRKKQKEICNIENLLIERVKFLVNKWNKIF